MSGIIGANNQFGKDFNSPDSNLQGIIVSVYDVRLSNQERNDTHTNGTLLNFRCIRLAVLLDRLDLFSSAIVPAGSS